MSRKSADPIVPQYLTCNKCGDTRPNHWFGFCSRDKKYRNPCKPCQAKNRDRLIGQLTAIDEGKKFCTNCERILPLEDFWKSKAGGQGRSTRCMDCKAQDEHQRKRRRNIQSARKAQVKEGHKVCHKCLVEYPEHWFSLNNKKTGKRETICRICTSRKPDLMRSKLTAIDNGKKWCNRCKSEKLEDEFSKPYKNGSHCLECNIETLKIWRFENPEKYKESNRQWREQNPETVRAMTAAGAANRRASEQASGGLVSTEDIARMVDAQQGKCYYCLAPFGNDYHVDHLTPVSRGGSSDASNLACTCQKCNLQKNSKTVREYIDWLLEKLSIVELDEREFNILMNFSRLD